MNKKRVLGILMSVLMMISMIPTMSFAADLPFTDVSASAWYYNDVKGAYETGLINGMTATTFEPESNMTYAQAVKLAACMHQKYTAGTVTLSNGSNDWWDSYVYYAKAFTIISKDYDWNNNATRAGFAEIFSNALPVETLSEKNSVADNAIPDVSISHPQAAAIYRLYRAGVLTGMDEKGTFLPDSNIKRSEISAILTRMMNKDSRKDIKLEVVIPTQYIIGFNSNGGSSVDAQKVNENEKVICPSEPKRDGFRFAGWYLDSELTKEYNFDNPVKENLYLYAKWIDPDTNGIHNDETTEIITDSWEEIISSVNNGTYKSKYKIGDTKALDLGPEGVVDMQIAAFDADELSNGSGKAAITWISKQTLKTDHRMNSGCLKDPADNSKYKLGTGSIGGWEKSEMRTWLKESVKPLIPDTVRNEIKPVIKYSFSRNDSNKSDYNVKTTDDIWIPSLREICKSAEYTETEGPSYSELFVTNYKDHVKMKSGSSSTWWLRSACYLSSFYIVNGEGKANYELATTSGGIAIGFCI